MNLSLTTVLVLSGLNAIIPFYLGWVGFLQSKRWLNYLASFTAGILLATAFLDILPSILPYIYTKAFVWFLIGLMGSFLFQRLEDRSAAKGQGVFMLVLTGIAHNLVYGAIIGAGFFSGLASATFGAIVLALSDIPHEIGVFGVLSQRGYDRRRSLILQAAIAAATIPGAVAAYLFRDHAVSLIPILLALLASWFTYWAVGDLMQELRTTDNRRWVGGLISLLLGALVVYWLVFHFGRGAFGYHPIYTDHPL